MVFENTRFMNQTIGEQAEREFLIRHTNKHPFCCRNGDRSQKTVTNPLAGNSQYLLCPRCFTLPLYANQRPISITWQERNVSRKNDAGDLYTGTREYPQPVAERKSRKVTNICNCVHNVEIIVLHFNKTLTWELFLIKWRAEESLRKQRAWRGNLSPWDDRSAIIRVTLFKDIRSVSFEWA